MSLPSRIQLRRTKGWRKPPNTVLVSRPTKWGNPFKVGDPGIETNADAVARFQEVYWGDAMSGIRQEIRRELRGKNLACWCKLGTPCHADVLIEIANPNP